METKIVNIVNEMAEYLDAAQLRMLQEVLLNNLSENVPEKKDISNEKYMEMYLEAKQIEGCSKRTLEYYRNTVKHLISYMDEPIRKVTTESLRAYLVEYQKINNCSKVTVVKNTISDECVEVLRNGCTEERDLAMIDLLYSTGIRVGELVNLNISDIDFEERECVVFGKGGKERKVYFDAKTKIHLQNYIKSRSDTEPALFVSLNAPHKRLMISGVEIRLRQLGKKLNVARFHPHKFRRTMATRAIDKGMPIEQVQRILGHSQIDTTMQYAMVNQSNVKNSHRKYIA